MNDILEKIVEELRRAKKKHPDWPLDVVYQAAIVTEEAGELTRAANQYVCEDGTLEALEEEIVQTAAMCFRMLEAIEAGKSLKGEESTRVYYREKGKSFDNSHFADYEGYSEKDALADMRQYRPELSTLSGTIYKLKL